MRLRPLGHLSRSTISAEERVGVEPTLDLRPNLISNQAPSATRPSLQDYFALAKADRLSPDDRPVDYHRTTVPSTGSWRLPPRPSIGRLAGLRLGGCAAIPTSCSW